MTSLQNPFSETTGYAYNADDTLNAKTLANGLSLVYGYDAADQMTDLHFGSGSGAYGHHYTYTPAGELQSRSESDGGTNTFSYDGADQLTREVRTGPVPFNNAYTYDSNGNRLTQTQNGTLTQSFTYNPHDVMKAGLNETPQWDLNGNMTGDTVNGQYTKYVYDDEDRLTSITLPDGHTDSFSYNGLGMRLTKQDPTGNYAYYTDGVSPASDVLSDNYSTFTPGISEINGQGSRFYLADASGNSRGLLNSSQAATDGYNWNAFGNLVSRFGSNPTGFAWNVSSGYQTDADDGLTLLGHRYYDKRIGRFISQDPIRDGTNWYAYCDNNPANLQDALGLTCDPFNSTGMTEGDVYDYVTSHGGEVGEEYETKDTKGNVAYSFTVAGFSYAGMSIVAPQGANINRDISQARQFYNSNASRDWRSIGHGQKIFTHDPKKVGDWLINNYGPGTEGDPKKYGKRYDAYGHAIYAAAASELQVTLPTILDGEVGVHNAMHLFSPGEEENGEYAGWGYDQHSNHPGPGIWTDSDFIPSAAGFLWQRLNGN